MIKLENMNESISVRSSTFTQYSQSYSRLQSINVSHQEPIKVKQETNGVYAGYIYTSERATIKLIVIVKIEASQR